MLGAGFLWLYLTIARAKDGEGDIISIINTNYFSILFLLIKYPTINNTIVIANITIVMMNNSFLVLLSCINEIFDRNCLFLISISKTVNSANSTIANMNILLLSSSDLSFFSSFFFIFFLP
jgi:hypothetical protein